MKMKGYNTVFILLSLCIFFILALQGFWIRNFYLQKTDEFNKTVYQCMEQISDKLHERENIHIIRRSFDSDSSLIQEDISEGPLLRNAFAHAHPAIKIVNSISSRPLSPERAVTLEDSVVEIRNNKKTIIVRKSTSDELPRRKEIKKLMGKMMLEIKGMEVSLTDSIRKDTLNNLIRRQLEYKGIFTPFEFSFIKKKNGKEKMLASSGGFDPKVTSFKSDLAAKHIFGTPYLLFIQFPSQAGFVFSEIKNVLLLSFFFSVIILTVFYFTVRSILRQKKISDMKNDFINNMTHELKTPIATISLAIDAINTPGVKSNTEKFNTYSRILKEENQKLNKQVERVLEISQLDKGELNFTKQPVNLTQIISSVVASYDLLIHDKKAVVKIFPAEPAVVEGDERHLTTVFSNLLDNALKYSHDSCEIEIRVEVSGKLVSVRIKDNGIGINKRLQEKIFEKFYRVQGGNLHDVKGFGLGLSYVKSIVEAHNGTISLNSEEGKGTEFILRFRSYAA
jgi:two-component system phosphate regulon sensor histidine kinase PhoR